MDWNAVRFDPEAGTDHVESYFLKLNDPSGRYALWLKATILAAHDRTPVSEAWAIAFDREASHVALKRVTPFKASDFSRSGLDVSTEGIALRPGIAKGRLEKDDSFIEWDLKFETVGDPLVPYPHPKMYEGKLPSQKLVTPYPNTRFSGSYRVNGREVRVDGWKGMQGHNWGSKHTELYAWGHVNQWEDASDLMLEGVTARVKVGPVLAPPLTLVCVWHEGKRYELTHVRTLLRARGSVSVEARRWQFESKSSEARIEGELVAQTDEMVGLYYENPNGQMTYCLNSKIARARLVLEPKNGPRLEAHSRSAALEIGTKNPDHGVRMMA